MTLRVSWRQALAWRMRRHLLDPPGDASVNEVVRRLCGVQAQVASSAELAIRLRQKRSKPGEVAEALAGGDLVRTWAMRGTLHYLAPEDAGAYLSLLAAARPWETPAWSNWFGLTPAVIERMRDAAFEALADGPLSRDELIRALSSRPGLAHVDTPLRESWGTAFKPLAWQGVLAFGPARNGRPTFVRPDLASPRWAGLPEADDAAPRAILAYAGAYGPATAERFRNWLGRGRIGKRLLDGWWNQAVAAGLTRIEVDGEAAFVPADLVDELAATRPTNGLRMLGGFDQWVMGPGTDDTHVVPARRRAAVSKQSGWIAPIIVAGGVVAGTWELESDVVRVGWFAERRGGKPAIVREVARLGTMLGRELAVEIATVPA